MDPNTVININVMLHSVTFWEALLWLSYPGERWNHTEDVSFRYWVCFYSEFTVWRESQRTLYQQCDTVTEISPKFEPLRWLCCIWLTGTHHPPFCEGPVWMTRARKWNTTFPETSLVLGCWMCFTELRKVEVKAILLSTRLFLAAGSVWFSSLNLLKGQVY